jgi:hypothetical protein
MCPQTVLASRRMLTHSNALVRVGSITGRCPWAQLGCACLVAGHDAWRRHCRDLGAHPTQFGGRGLVGFQNSNGGGSCDLASNVSHFSRFHRFRGHSLPSLTRVQGGAHGHLRSSLTRQICGGHMGKYISRMLTRGIPPPTTPSLLHTVTSYAHHIWASQPTQAPGPCDVPRTTHRHLPDVGGGCRRGRCRFRSDVCDMRA